MIYVFGDSHRAFFTNTHPGSDSPATKDIFRSYTLGPGTAHNFYENRYDEMLSILLSATIVDCVLIVAGEIDCRLHIPKIHLETGERIPVLVENTVQRFMKAIDELTKLGYKVIVWGPHPTRHLETLDYEWRAGDQQMRNQTCLAFNGALALEARRRKLPFATPFYTILKEYDTYTVHDGCYRDALHLNQLLWPSTRKILGEMYDKYDDFQQK